MTDHERYMFDLQGYLVIPDALSAEHLRELNALMDERVANDCEPDMRTHRWVHMLPWGEPYRRLIDLDSVRPYIEELVGSQFRLDHEYADITRAGKGPIGTSLHAGPVPFNPCFYYSCDGESFANGLIALVYNLKDVNEGDGGFGCMPGSHKSNNAMPKSMRELDDAHPRVDRVTGPAGSAVIFTEALIHGTLPWNGADERRTLFYKYSPHALSWAAGYYDADAFDDLTDAQRAALEAPNARYGGRVGPTYGGVNNG
ncbi:mitomycin antibiotics/polyketide fumonisin biosynthesis protein [Candidatus Poribacteria bacterium]|nr:mitomycin antibiotics/polyketide fumonisin biosynthesis protein [Candidatus Poribacteria bacterium]